MTIRGSFWGQSRERYAHLGETKQPRTSAMSVFASVSTELSVGATVGKTYRPGVDHVGRLPRPQTCVSSTIGGGCSGHLVRIVLNGLTTDRLVTEAFDVVSCVNVHPRWGLSLAELPFRLRLRHNIHLGDKGYFNFDGRDSRRFAKSASAITSHRSRRPHLHSNANRFKAGMRRHPGNLASRLRSAADVWIAGKAIHLPGVSVRRPQS